MRVDLIGSSIDRIASVTCHDIANKQIEQKVGQSGCEQNGKGHEDMHVVPGNRTSQNTDGYQHDADLLREIFSDVQVRAGASQALDKQGA